MKKIKVLHLSKLEESESESFITEDADEEEETNFKPEK